MFADCSNQIVNEGGYSAQGGSHEKGAQENDKCKEERKFSIIKTNQYQQFIESYSKDNMSISHSSLVDDIDDLDIDGI